MLTLNLTEGKSFPDLYTSSCWLTHCVNTESLGDLLCTKGCLVRTSRYSIDELSYVSLNCKAQEEVLSRTCLPSVYAGAVLGSAGHALHTTW